MMIKMDVSVVHFYLALVEEQIWYEPMFIYDMHAIPSFISLGDLTATILRKHGGWGVALNFQKHTDVN